MIMEKDQSFMFRKANMLWMFLIYFTVLFIKTEQISEFSDSLLTYISPL